MSNNELYEHKRSDTVKWVISFFLILVLLVGMVGTWVFLLREDEGKTPPVEEEQTEQAAVTDGEGNAMDADMVYPMPAKMSFSAQTFAQFGEPNAVTSEQSVDVRIQAYVTPEDWRPYPAKRRSAMIPSLSPSPPARADIRLPAR